MKALESQQLINVGRVPAVRAEDLKVGMYRRFNYGSHEQIVDIKPKGLQSLVVTVKLKADGRLFSRTLRKTSVVAVVTDKDRNVVIDPVEG